MKNNQIKGFALGAVSACLVMGVAYSAVGVARNIAAVSMRSNLPLALKNMSIRLMPRLVPSSPLTAKKTADFTKKTDLDRFYSAQVFLFAALQTLLPSYQKIPDSSSGISISKARLLLCCAKVLDQLDHFTTWAMEKDILQAAK